MFVYLVTLICLLGQGCGPAPNGPYDCLYVAQRQSLACTPAVDGDDVQGIEAPEPVRLRAVVVFDAPMLGPVEPRALVGGADCVLDGVQLTCAAWEPLR